MFAPSRRTTALPAQAQAAFIGPAMTMAIAMAMAMVIACLLAACGDDAPEPSKAAPAAASAPAPKVARISQDMVAAVSAGKTASAISVHFALGAPPIVDQALPVKIVIVPHRKFGSVRAHFEAHDGLSITAGDDYGPKADADIETTLEHQLMLMPSLEGVFMVTTSVDTEGDDGTVTRIFTIPVIVGPAQGAAPARAPAAAPSQGTAEAPAK